LDASAAPAPPCFRPAAPRTNDATCSHWPTTTAPIRLYASPTDEQVALADSTVCAARLDANGTPVTVVTLPPLGALRLRTGGLGQVLVLFLADFPPSRG
jgi:hypothetical protein